MGFFSYGCRYNQRIISGINQFEKEHKVEAKYEVNELRGFNKKREKEIIVEFIVYIPKFN